MKHIHHYTEIIKPVKYIYGNIVSYGVRFCKCGQLQSSIVRDTEKRAWQTVYEHNGLSI